MEDDVAFVGAACTSGEACGLIANEFTEDIVTAARARAVAHTEAKHDLIVVLYYIYVFVSFV